MSDFDAAAFASEPSEEALLKLRKEDLIALTNYLNIEIKRSTTKSEIQRIILQFLKMQETTTVDADNNDSQNFDNNLEMMRLKLEMKKIELEMENERSKREHELALKKLEFQLINAETNKSHDVFDLTKHIRFVPNFDEADVDKFFLHFEKVAISMKWPEESWVMLLQTALRGKAREIYTQLSIDEAQYYDLVKKLILNAYELVPEAYRQKFRSLSKKKDETFHEFAKTKELLLNRWLSSQDVGADFEKLKQLIIIEEFKNRIPADVRTYIEEQRVDDIHVAARLADEYALIHKVSFSHKAADEPKPQPANRPVHHESRHPSMSKKTCFYCKREGHVVSNCFKLKNKNQSVSNFQEHNKVNGFVATAERNPNSPNFADTLIPELSPQKGGKVHNDVRDPSMDVFEPFIYDGLVSLNEDMSEATPVSILRDTGASQSLVLANTLPFSRNSSAGSNVLIKGINCSEYMPVPLHAIHLKSSILSGRLLMGITDHLPFKGIAILLGNDLAGDRVFPNPILTERPSLEKLTTPIDSSVGLYPSCAVTRSMSFRQENASDIEDDSRRNIILGQRNDPEITSLSELARSSLESCQKDMKDRFDVKAVRRNFDVGQKVLVLLPVQNNPLQARYVGPYVIQNKISEVNYVLSTPDRRKKTQLCHVNMLKTYFDRSEITSREQASVNVVCSYSENNLDESNLCDVTCSAKLTNSESLQNLEDKLKHLDINKKEDLLLLVGSYEHLFSDSPTQTNVIFHDVDVGDASPIKQHPYRTNPIKQQHMEKEIRYLLENGFIEPSKSNWSSPCILVPKPDGSYRLCTDYRKLNNVTKSDSYPIPRMEDCVDKIGNALYVTKFDLLKGFWQVPLTDRAKEVSAFVVPSGLYQYKVMPFGMKNSPATFQRMMNQVIAGINDCEVYIDDIVIYSVDWQVHIDTIAKLFDRLSEANLTINLAKSEFGCAHLTYLGHVVGQGRVRPVHAKVEAVANFPTPEDKKQLMRFLGMAGYYRKFCPNFSAIAEPLTSILSKRVPFTWNSECDVAFQKLKAILMNDPVLAAPNFSRSFKLAVDASDVAVGGVLLQDDANGIEHPVSYFSKKLLKNQRNYSTIEKECLSIILAVQHFEVYLSCCSPIVIYSDHSPLVFLNKMKMKNQRLLRWSLFLQSFDFQIKRIKGKDNLIADCLSRVHF